MSFNAAALQMMLDKGLSLGDVVDIATANERRVDKTATERKRRQRAKEAVSRRDVTSDAVPPNDNILTPSEENSEPKGSSQKFVLPADIPAEPWDGWEQMRKRIRKAPTDHARTLAVTELRRLRDEEGWPPGDVLNHCTMNSYQGIYPPKGRSDGRKPGIGKTTAAIAANGGFNDDSPM